MVIVLLYVGVERLDGFPSHLCFFLSANTFIFPVGSCVCVHIIFSLPPKRVGDDSVLTRPEK